MSHIAITTTGLSVALAAGLLAAPAVLPAPASASSVAMVSPALAQVATSTPAVTPNAKSMYVGVVRSGTTARLQLIDRTTGATVATLTSAPMNAVFADPYRDAVIAPDGTVWAIQTGDAPYSSRLIRIGHGWIATFMPYATGVRMSPDGTRLAVTVISPDADHDGKGTASLRVGSVKGGAFPTLVHTTFPVGANGAPTTQIPAPNIGTWLGNHTLALQFGCCGSGNVSVVSADKPTNFSTLSVLGGDATSRVVAKIGDDAALVPIVQSTQDASGSWAPTSVDIYRISPEQPRGVKVAHRAVANADPTPQLSAYIASVGATPMYPWLTHLPYQPVPGATLVDSYIGR